MLSIRKRRSYMGYRERKEERRSYLGAFLALAFMAAMILAAVIIEGTVI